MQLSHVYTITSRVLREADGNDRVAVIAVRARMRRWKRYGVYPREIRILECAALKAEMIYDVDIAGE